MSKSFSLILLLFIALSSCKDETDCCVLPESTIIRYGTSFGFCVGYCKRSITLNSSSIEFIKSSWQDENNYPTVSCTNDFEAWEQLQSKIDIDEFKEMDETIGCPDCADGGAEWIEILSGEDTHKVTFEHNKAPSEFEPFIDDLRDQLENQEINCQ
ncbi:MAG: hypothetical protein JXQ96_11035 [Cyclobacteriaceae bacterium]